MSCCSSSLVGRLTTSGCCASRATLPPVRRRVRSRRPAGTGAHGRRPSAVLRGRSTRRWGAGVLPGRARCRRDRVRRPAGRSRPSRRSPATTHACWPAADIRCRSGPELLRVAVPARSVDRFARHRGSTLPPTPSDSEPAERGLRSRHANGHGERVTSLQCPATLLLAAPDAALPAGIRIAQEWPPDEVPDCSPMTYATLSEALADRRPDAGRDHAGARARRSAARRPAPPGPDRHGPRAARDAPVLALEIDADDWVVRAVRA